MSSGGRTRGWPPSSSTRSASEERAVAGRHHERRLAGRRRRLPHGQSTPVQHVARGNGRLGCRGVRSAPPPRVPSARPLRVRSVPPPRVRSAPPPCSRRRAAPSTPAWAPGSTGFAATAIPWCGSRVRWSCPRRCRRGGQHPSGRYFYIASSDQRTSTARGAPSLPERVPGRFVGRPPTSQRGGGAAAPADLHHRRPARRVPAVGLQLPELPLPSTGSPPTDRSATWSSSGPTSTRASTRTPCTLMPSNRAVLLPARGQRARARGSTPRTRAASTCTASRTAS